MIWGELLWKTVSKFRLSVGISCFHLICFRMHLGTRICWMSGDIQLWNYDKCYYIWTKIKPYLSSWENNAERQNLSYCPILHFHIYCCIIIVSCNISFIIWKNKKVLNYSKTPLHVNLMEIIIWDFLFLFSSIHDIELPCERSPSVYKKTF